HSRAPWSASTWVWSCDRRTGHSFDSRATEGAAMDRRTFLAAGGAGVAVMNDGGTARAETSRGHIVLVHGSWHGGWCWSLAKPLLEAAGYTVTAPTLTGVGERRHLIARSVN